MHLNLALKEYLLAKVGITFEFFKCKKLLIKLIIDLKLEATMQTFQLLKIYV